MVSVYIDATTAFNANGGYVQEIGEWDWVTVQLVSPTGTVTFNSTNDPGAITGIGDGNAKSATNWIATQGTNLNSGTAITTIAASGLIRFAVIGRFLQLSSTGQTATLVIIKLSKIE